jgi:hypothetical protein
MRGAHSGPVESRAGRETKFRTRLSKPRWNGFVKLAVQWASYHRFGAMNGRSQILPRRITQDLRRTVDNLSQVHNFRETIDLNGKYTVCYLPALQYGLKLPPELVFQLSREAATASAAIFASFLQARLCLKELGPPREFAFSETKQDKGGRFCLTSSTPLRWLRWRYSP